MDVFISYKREDRAQVSLLADSLRGVGLAVWFDESLTSGEVYTAEIDRQLTESRAVLVCWSRAAADSEFVVAEAQKAWALKKLAAVSLDRGFDAMRLPLPLNGVQTPALHGQGSAVEHENWPSVVARLLDLCGRSPLYPLWQFKSDVDARRRLPSAASGLEHWLKQHANDPAAPIAEGLLARLAPQRDQLRADERRLADLEAREQERQFATEQKRLREQLDTEERARRLAERQSREARRSAAERAARALARWAVILGSCAAVVMGAAFAWTHQDLFAASSGVDAQRLRPIARLSRDRSESVLGFLAGGDVFATTGCNVTNLADRKRIRIEGDGWCRVDGDSHAPTILAEDENGLRIMDLRTGRQAVTIQVGFDPKLKGYSFFQSNISALSPDGTRLIAVPGFISSNARRNRYPRRVDVAAVFDLSSGRRAGAIPITGENSVEHNICRDIEFSDSDLFGCRLSEVKAIWSTRTGRVAYELPHQFVSFVPKSPDLILFRGEDRQLLRWNPQAPDQLQTVRHCGDPVLHGTNCFVVVTERGVLRVDVSPNSAVIVDAMTGAPLSTISSPRMPYRLESDGLNIRRLMAVSPNGRYLLAMTTLEKDIYARVWDLSQAEARLAFEANGAGKPLEITPNAFSPNSDRFFLADVLGVKVFQIPR